MCMAVLWVVFQQAPVPVSLPPFSVEITKGEERLCFHMELVEGEEDSYDFRVEEFYVAPAAKPDNEDVEDHVYASSGKYIDPVGLIICGGEGKLHFEPSHYCNRVGLNPTCALTVSTTIKKDKLSGRYCN